MTGLVTLGQQPGTAAQLPVSIDYPAALALRQMALVQDELPKYLLAPEVSALFHYVPDLHRKMLLATLWNTGARINEALALTRGDFSLAPPYPFAQLATLKQRASEAYHKRPVSKPAAINGWMLAFLIALLSAEWGLRRWWSWT